MRHLIFCLLSCILYFALLFTLWIIITRQVEAPKETNAISFAEFIRHFGSGDLLLVRAPSSMTILIEKNFRSCPLLGHFFQLSQ